MRRKLVQHGPTTLIASLPTKWVKKHDLKKGDEIEVEEKEEKLIISPINTTKEIKKISINLTKHNPKILDFLLPLPHKIGYDEVEIKYDDPEIPRLAQKRISEMLLGYEIIEQSSNKLLIKNITSSNEDEIENLLRRLFLVTLTFGKEIKESLDNKKDTSLLLNLEETINRLSNLIQRLINTQYHKDDSCFLYLIVWNLESIGDNYRDICELELNVETDLLEKVNFFFEEYLKLFYKFNLNKVLEMKQKRKELIKEIKEQIPKNSEYHLNLLWIVERIADALGSTAALNQAAFCS